MPRTKSLQDLSDGNMEDDDLILDLEEEKTSEIEEIDINLEKYAAFDKDLKKKFGDNYKPSGQSFESVEFFPLECISINRILGGGLPVGRLVELYGPNHTGKSTVALHCVHSLQKQGKKCLWLDVESAFEPAFAEQCKVNVDDLMILTPETATDALEVVRRATQSGFISLVIVDSVA